MDKLTSLATNLTNSARANKLAQALANRSAEAAGVAESDAVIAEAEAAIAKAKALAMRRFSLDAEDAAEDAEASLRSAKVAYDEYLKL